MTSSNRLSSIDVLKAIAIMMMLQGHFIDTLLAPEFRNTEIKWYSIWRYGRGFTAPLFFTISGLVLAYTWKPERMKKFMQRGIELVFWGYLLKANVFSLLTGYIHHRSWVTDVLHIIGLCVIIAPLFLRALAQSPRIAKFLIINIMGLFILVVEPITDVIDTSSLPRFLGYYINESTGSVFSFFHWSGFFIFGLSLGFVLPFLAHDRIRYLMALIIIFSGIIIRYAAEPFLSFIYTAFMPSGFDNLYVFKDRFVRLSEVTTFIGITYGFEALSQKAKGLLRIGQQTFSIYIIHSFILYGSLTGIGLASFLRKSLEPFIVIPGALIFIVITIWLSNRIRPDLIFKNLSVKGFLS